MPGFIKMIKGRFDEAEVNLIRTVIGEHLDDKKINLQKIKTFWIPGNFKSFRIANFSLPFKIIGIPENPRSSVYDKSILIHEIFHQMQYRKSIISFARLIIEQIIHRLFGKNVYEYGRDEFLNGGNIIKTLDDIKTLEGQASFAQDFANNYLSYLECLNVYPSLDVNKKKKELEYKTRAGRYAKVLKNSGISSKAIDELTG